MFTLFVRSLAVVLGVGVFGSLMSACNPQITLTVRANAGGTVAVSPTAASCMNPPTPTIDVGGISYQQTCYGYSTVTSVTLTAMPQDGFAFAGWSGNCKGHDQCVVAMSAARTVTARFRHMDDPIPLSYQASDAKLDPVRNQLFVSDKTGKKLHIYDNTTGNEISTLSFVPLPERLFLDAASNTLFVTLLAQEHSAYWWEEDQKGYVAMIDLDSLQVVRRISIDTDPFDLVVSGDKLVVSSGSGQWTTVNMYSVASGDRLSEGYIWQQSFLTFDPYHQWVYATTTGLSPADMDKFDIGTNTLQLLGLDGDGPLNLDSFSTSRNVFVPGVHSFLSRSGNAFLTTADNPSYLRFAQTLPITDIADAAIPASGNFYFIAGKAGEQYQVGQLNKSSHQLAGTASLPEQGQFLSADESRVTVLTSNGTRSTIRYLSAPCPECLSNIAPQAEFTVSPASGGDINTNFVLDASISSDADNDDLTARWDFDSDGKFDTEFSAGMQIAHRFTVAGPQKVTVQVKDRVGNAVTRTLGFDVAIVDGVQPGQYPSAMLQFVTADAVVDSLRNRLYATDRSQKRLYVVNLASGLIERYFEFEQVPESLAITPDSSRLYVALLTGPHSYVRAGNDGYIAEFDLASTTKIKEFHVEVDPYDLAVTAAGKLVVAGGSNQWTNIQAYDTTSGLLLGSADIYHQAHIALHPNQQWIYAVSTSLSPRDVEKFDISGAGITRLYDSKYHGDFAMGIYIFMSPDGGRLITSAGSMFTTTATRNTDLNYMGELYAANSVAFSPSNSAIYLQDSVSQRRLGWPSDGTLRTDAVGGHFIFISGNQVVSLKLGASNTLLTKHAM